MQDEVYENVEMRDPSTTHGRAITHFCVARRQGVKKPSSGPCSSLNLKPDRSAESDGIPCTVKTESYN
jgi:hypothetical protein